MAPSSDDLGRRHKRQRRNGCPDLMYYDEAIPGCTPCDHLCDDYEFQGTEKQCIEKCYKYYMRHCTTQPARTTTTTTRKPHGRVIGVTESGHVLPVQEIGLQWAAKGNAILAVVVVLLTLSIFGVIAYVVWRKRNVWCRRQSSEDVKTSVPCSEEDGLHNVGDSTKPLMGSCGPIRQVENCPQQELSDVKRQLAEGGSSSILYPLTFAEFGGPQYTVLDGPLTSLHRHSTIPKEAYQDDSAGNQEIHVTTPKETLTDEPSGLMNTQSLRSEGGCSVDREHDLSAS